MNKISGKKLLFYKFQHKENEIKNCRVPWVPFAGIHAGKLRNYTATEILTEPSKLIESLLEVNKLYNPDGQPILFDLQIEAEILGCDLKWSEKSPPSVISHPLADTLIIPDKIPKKTDGRLPLVLDVMKKMKEKIGKTTALFGLITGPLTLASHLRGTKLFMDLVRNKEYAYKLLKYCHEIAKIIANYYIEAGMDVIAIVDPVVSQISPRTFEAMLLDFFTDFFKHINQKKVLSSFFVCGDATKNIEPMCKSNPDSIFVDENIDMKTTQEITDRYNIILGGNIPLTRTMLFGTQQDNMKCVLNLLDSLDHKNLIIAPGCDMPYDIPPDNVIGVIETLNDPEKVRKALETYESSEIDIVISLPDYNNLKNPLIEVFTLDSEQCAACSYMKDMAFSAKNDYGDKIDIIEYKWTELENIARTKKMGIKHLPCILINGSLKWSSIIPDQEEYFAEIDKYL